MANVDKEVVRHGSFTIDPDERELFRVELNPGFPTVSVNLRLTGTLDNTTGGPAGDQVVRAEAVERFLDAHLHVVNPNTDLVRKMSLRQLVRYHNLNVSAVSTLTQPDQSTLNGGNTTDFEVILKLWGMRRYLSHRTEVFWPAWDGIMGPEADHFYLDIFPNRGRVNSASDRGTDAFLSAGSDTIVFSTTPTLEVEQEIAPNLRGPLDGRPRFLPTYHSEATKTYQAATETHDHQPTHGERMDLVLIRQDEGADRNAVDIDDANAFNNLSIGANRLDVIDERVPAFLENEARDDFHAFDGAGAGDDFDGYIPVLLAAGGRPLASINPRDYVQFQYLWDVPAPGSTPGEFQVFSALLEEL